MLNLDKKIIFLVFGRIVQSILAILSIKLLVLCLPQAEVGRQYLVNSVLLWFSLVLINPVGMYINRHIHEWKNKGQLYSQLKQINKYFTLVALISIPIIFFIKRMFAVGAFLSYAEIFLFVFAYVYFSTWYQTLVSFFNLLDYQKTFIFLSTLSQFLGLLFAVIGVKFVENSAIVWMIGLLVGQVFSLFLALYFFKKYFLKTELGNKLEVNNFFMWSTFKFCFPVAVTTLFMWFMNQGYRLIVDRLMNVEILASIGLGLGLAASIASIVESVTTQYFYPGYYAALADSSVSDRKIAWKKLFEKTLAVYIPCCFLTLSVSQLMVRTLTSEQFYVIVPYVCFGAAIELFRQLSNISYLVSHSEKKTINTIMPYFLGTVVISASLIVMHFTKNVSPENILQSLIFASLVTYVYNFIVVKRLIQVSFNYQLAVKAVFLSMPLIFPFLYMSVSDNIISLFLFGILSGFWCLLVIYFMLKNKIKV